MNLILCRNLRVTNFNTSSSKITGNENLITAFHSAVDSGATENVDAHETTTDARPKPDLQPSMIPEIVKPPSAPKT